MRKLVTVAKMYYEDNLTQSQIAKALGVSRPLISIYLSEAKELGIVDIKINSPFELDSNTMDILCHSYGIRGGALIEGLKSKSMTENLIANSACEFLRRTANKGDCIGISWGNMLGSLVSLMENKSAKYKLGGSVCSLIGNSATANKNYHTDELCRAFGQAFDCEPRFALVPAFYETNEDLASISELDYANKSQRNWDHIRFALLNIENYPSVPDLATASRFGRKLKDAVGHMASYYYDINGRIIQSENDIVFRISIDQLKQADIVIGLCGSDVSVPNLIGALNTGIITHIFVEQRIAQEAIKQGGVQRPAGRS